MKKALIIATVTATVLWGTAAQAGVVIGGTRIIYNGGEKESTIEVRNRDKTPWLIQSWTDDNGLQGQNKNAPKTPFQVTPSLYKLGAASSDILHITLTEDTLPKDKESLYWINIKSIPEVAKAKGNTLTISVNQRFKLIYRPVGLKAPAEADYKKITFNVQGKKIRVNNPTPYWFTFYSLKAGGKAVNTAGKMVPPKSQINYVLPSGVTSNEVSWQVINDYGGNSSTLAAKAKTK